MQKFDIEKFNLKKLHSVVQYQVKNLK